MKAEPSSATSAGSSPKAREAMVSALCGSATSSTGARSTVTPSGSRNCPVASPSERAASASPASPSSAAESSGGPLGRRFTSPPSWSIITSSGGLSPSVAACWSAVDVGLERGLVARRHDHAAELPLARAAQERLVHPALAAAWRRRSGRPASSAAAARARPRRRRENTTMPRTTRTATTAPAAIACRRRTLAGRSRRWLRLRAGNRHLGRSEGVVAQARHLAGVRVDRGDLAGAEASPAWPLRPRAHRRRGARPGRAAPAGAACAARRGGRG